MKKNEFELIDLINKKVPQAGPQVILGIGDDAAVVDTGGSAPLLATTDCLVESQHFTWQSFTPFEIGHKALAVNLSDIAAMGGQPQFALVSLGIPENFDEEKISQFYDGFLALAQKSQVDLIGGNITRSSHSFFVSVTVLGRPLKENIFYRHLAQTGDVICITGPLGYAALGVHFLTQNPQTQNTYTQKQKCPSARVDAAQFLAGQSGVHAVIDISDGLSGDLAHILKSSDKGAIIDQSKLPCSDDFKNSCRSLNLDPYELILNGGEDYELLFTLDASKATQVLKDAASQNLIFTPIGLVTKQGQKYRQTDGTETDLIPQSFTHF